MGKLPHERINEDLIIKGRSTIDYAFLDGLANDIFLLELMKSKKYQNNINCLKLNYMRKYNQIFYNMINKLKSKNLIQGN